MKDVLDMQAWHDLSSAPRCSLFSIHLLLWGSLSETVSGISTVSNSQLHPDCFLSTTCFQTCLQSDSEISASVEENIAHGHALLLHADSIICDSLLDLYLKYEM